MSQSRLSQYLSWARSRLKSAFRKSVGEPYAEELNDLYERVLLRPIDPSGYEAYAALLKKGDMSLSGVEGILRGSEEYQKLIERMKPRPGSRRFRLRDGAELNYEVMGDRGPWVAIISGGRQSLLDLEEMARLIAANAHRVLIYDRRNCGRSSIDFDFTRSEDDVWADDLNELLAHLGASPALVVGRSLGARVALKLALAHPSSVRQLLLWGVSGGQVALRVLSKIYYGRFLQACKSGGMEKVCSFGHFAGMIALNSNNRDLLLSVHPDQFISAMRNWRELFIAGGNHPVIGEKGVSPL